jgi:3-hydroxyisobutyrate dehydrogenase-like beta-hydroxyacid dehydrogenase
MAEEERKVGIVGLGTMGGAFARHLVAAGWRVIGYDVSAKARRAAQSAGVTLAKDAAALASAAPTIITSLPEPAALDATVAAIVAASAPHRTVVEMSTFTLADKERAARALQRAGHLLLDCPVSGTGAQAAAKDIVIYASGNARALRRLMPMFAAFARETHAVGAFGNGSRVKYVANLLVAIHNVATAEAMVLGAKAGLDPEQLIGLIRAGAGTSRIFELRAPLMAAGRYRPATMTVKLWQKDMAVIGDFAAALGCPTPLFSATLPLYAAALATGHAEHDTAAVCAVLEAMAGHRRRPRARAAVARR